MTQPIAPAGPSAAAPADSGSSLPGLQLRPGLLARGGLYIAIAAILNLAVIALLIQRRLDGPFEQFIYIYFLITSSVAIINLLIFLTLLIIRRKREWLADIEEHQWPSLTVIVPCHNEEAFIAATLRSLLQIDYPDLQVIVVDDGSTDQTAAIVRQFTPRVQLLQQAKAGKAAALNRGIASLGSDLVLLVDADCLFPPESLRLAVRYLLRQGDDAVGGHLRVANQSCFLGRLQDLEYGGIVMRRYFNRYALNLSRTQDIIPGALGLFRSAVLRAAGPLASDLLAEDVDLTARLVEQGRLLGCCPYLHGATVVPETLPALIIQRKRWVQGYLQVTLRQLRRFAQIDNRSRLAALAMLHRTLVLPFNTALSIVTIVVFCLRGWPLILPISLGAMLFPFSVQGLTRFLRADFTLLLAYNYFYGLFLFGWQMIHQLSHILRPSPHWQPYRRLRPATRVRHPIRPAARG